MGAPQRGAKGQHLPRPGGGRGRPGRFQKLPTARGRHLLPAGELRLPQGSRESKAPMGGAGRAGLPRGSRERRIRGGLMLLKHRAKGEAQDPASDAIGEKGCFPRRRSLEVRLSITRLASGFPRGGPSSRRAIPDFIPLLRGHTRVDIISLGRRSLAARSPAVREGEARPPRGVMTEPRPRASAALLGAACGSACEALSKVRVSAQHRSQTAHPAADGSVTGLRAGPCDVPRIQHDSKMKCFLPISGRSVSHREAQAGAGGAGVCVSWRGRRRAATVLSRPGTLSRPSGHVSVPGCIS